MPSLKQTLKKAKVPKKPSSQEPVWKGPEDDGPRGGITQSMLSNFIVCRERFRLRVIEGLDLAPSFNHRMEYGSMWHVCEEALASYDSRTGTQILSVTVENTLKAYCKSLCEKYRLQQEQIVHWMNVCNAQFPAYINYWRSHPDVKERTPLLQEQVFHVPYKLPSGRVVYLRGKWDSVDLIGKGKNAGVYLMENKTKGDIKEEVLRRQLQSGFDLQTMLYLVALTQQFPPGTKCLPPKAWDNGIHGVRYNVIRRPLAGGKYGISQYKPSKSNPTGETPEEFYVRLGGLIREDPSWFFMRWKVEVSQADIQRFCVQCLDPLLEQLCEWWYVMTHGGDLFGAMGGQSWIDRDYQAPIHWRTPYGIWNILAEGGNAEVDEYLNTGSDLGLVRGVPLFPELQ